MMNLSRSSEKFRMCAIPADGNDSTHVHSILSAAVLYSLPLSIDHLSQVFSSTHPITCSINHEVFILAFKIEWEERKFCPHFQTGHIPFSVFRSQTPSPLKSHHHPNIPHTNFHHPITQKLYIQYPPILFFSNQHTQDTHLTNTNHFQHLTIGGSTTQKIQPQFCWFHVT